MKLTGGTLSGLYAPDVGNNRETRELLADIRGATAGSYRGAIRSAAIAKASAAGAEEIADGDIVERGDEALIASHIVALVGPWDYENATLPPAPVQIGGRSVQPGETIRLANGAELVDALRSAGEATEAFSLYMDLVRAIKSRAHLAAGLVPT